MSQLPPRRKLPSSPTGYHLPIREQGPLQVESEPPRSLSPPPGAVTLRGNGWKLSMPWAVILALGSAVGARYLPTNTATDVKIDRQGAEQQERDRRDAERWEDVRSRLKGIEERLGRLEDARANDRLVVDELRKRLDRERP